MGELETHADFDIFYGLYYFVSSSNCGFNDTTENKTLVLVSLMKEKPRVHSNKDSEGGPISVESQGRLL